jgi:hypothetical protein
MLELSQLFYYYPSANPARWDLDVFYAIICLIIKGVL